jgi:hypothetical protein
MAERDWLSRRESRMRVGSPEAARTGIDQAALEFERGWAFQDEPYLAAGGLALLAALFYSGISLFHATELSSISGAP